MKALVGAFNQEKALLGAISGIVKTGCGTDGSFYSNSSFSLHYFIISPRHRLRTGDCVLITASFGNRDKLIRNLILLSAKPRIRKRSSPVRFRQSLCLQLRSSRSHAAAWPEPKQEGCANGGIILGLSHVEVSRKFRGSFTILKESTYQHLFLL